MKFGRFLREIRFSRLYPSTTRSIPVFNLVQADEGWEPPNRGMFLRISGKSTFIFFYFFRLQRVNEGFVKLELLRGRMASAGDARPHADRVIKRAVCRDLQHPSLPDDACSKERGAAGPDGGRDSTHAGCGHSRGDAAAGEQLKQETLRVVSSGNAVYLLFRSSAFCARTAFTLLVRL